jgi:hypothetical protein
MAGAAAPRLTATAVKILDVSVWPAGQARSFVGASSWMLRRTSKETSQTRQRKSYPGMPQG